MNESRATWLITVLFVMLALAIFVVIYPRARLAVAPPPTTSITIFNPYGSNVLLRLKCDWNQKKYQYNIIRQYLLKRDGAVQITIPTGSKDCQIWPKVRYF